MERFVDEFAEPEFIELNLPYFERYVELRVQGYDPRDSFVRAFGSENYPDAQQGYRRTSDIEESDWFKSAFQAKLLAAEAKNLWDVKTSIHEMLTLVRGPYIKDAVKLNAIKELNVLCGITIVDENGKTKAGRSLADFYKTEGLPSNQPESGGTPEANTQH